MSVFRFVVAVVGLSLALPAMGQAQGRSTRDGNVGQPNTSVPPFNVPTVNRVKVMVNVAAELIEHRRRLGLDDAAVEGLRGLAAEIDTRNEPALATFDSLRTVARANNNTAQSGTLDGRATTAQMNQTARDLGGLRDGDIEKALAFVPADKHEAAKTILQNQRRDFDRALGRRQ